MRHELRSFAGAESLAFAAADLVSETVEGAVTASGRCSIAVSGGTTPTLMLADLAGRDLAWEAVTVFQVDERVAPLGDSARNLTALMPTLGRTRAAIEPMPVNDADLTGAARRYSESLPEHFDLVHLGLGPDGHTASLVPDDADLEDDTDLVTLTGLYQGHRRMTLTYPALARARLLVWLVAGAEKHDALERLLGGDTSIPAGRVSADRSIVLADAAAL